MRNRIRTAFAASIEPIRLARAYIADARRYYLSTVGSRTAPRRREGAIIQLSHSMEKRLSFRNGEPSFGKDKAYRLISLIESSAQSRACGDEIVMWAIGVVREYCSRFMDEAERNECQKRLDAIRAMCFGEVQRRNLMAGTLEISREDVLAGGKGDFQRFATTRHSVREFAGPVDIAVLKEAISLAQRCPSTCNLQPVRVYCIESTELVRNVMSVQGGNRGFGYGVPQVTVVAADLSLYSGAKQRNQCYVDGGIFALSLAYSLHYFGVGACFLNWAASCEEDRRLRSWLHIREEEVVVALLAMGKLPVSAQVPVSQRRNLQSIFEVL